MHLFQYYKQYIFCRDMIIKMNYSNPYECIQFSSISLNFSSKNVVSDKKQILPAIVALKMITGQKPKTIRAKKSVASFKLKAQNLIGCRVTLRKKKMFLFLQNLLQIVLPKTKEFRRVLTSSYHQKNYIHFGVQNFLAFPEVEKNVEIFEHLSGYSIALKVNYVKNREIFLLLTAFKLPCSHF